MIVYTVITGGYDALRSTKWPATCLTTTDLESAEGWKLRKISKMHRDNQRASRHPKMLPHLYFPEAEYSLYIDGNIQLLTAPEELVDLYLKKTDMALFPHPQRKCTYHEATKCLRRKKADPNLVKAQMSHYKRLGFPKGYGLTACWVILRRHAPLVQAFGESWWDAYLKFSGRDQLCFDFVRWELGISYTKLPGNLFKNTSDHFLRREHGDPLAEAVR